MLLSCVANCSISAIKKEEKRFALESFKPQHVTQKAQKPKQLRTIIQSLCFSLQGHARSVCLYASMAATGTLWTFQRNLDVTQLSSTEGTAMDQLILMDNSSSNTYTVKIFIFISVFEQLNNQFNQSKQNSASRLQSLSFNNYASMADAGTLS